MPPGKRLQRLDGGIDIGGFGIVVVLDAANCGHKFQAMLHRLEFGDRVADLLRLESGQHSDAHRGQHVLQVVRALQ